MLIDSLKRLSKDSLIYGMGSIIEYIAAFILLPIFTRIFSPSDYGILDTIGTLISIITLFLLMGMNSSMQRYYFDAEKESNEGAVVISTTVWFVLGSSLLTSIAISLFASPISNLLFGTTEYANLIVIAIAGIPAALLITLFKDVLRLKFMPWKFSIMSVVQFLLRISIIIVLILVFKMGLEGNFYGVFVSSVITALLAIMFIRKNVKLSFSPTYLKQMLKFGVPLAFAGFAYWIINLSDRLFLLKFSTLSELGLYSVGNRISSVLVLAITALHLAWSPLIFETYKSEGSKRFIIKTFTYSLLAFMFIAILLTTFSRDVISILAPPEYLGSIYVVGLLSLGSVFLGISGIISTGLTIIKKTKFITISAVIAASINLLLNFALIPNYGIIGASLATMISYLVLVLSYHFFSKNYYPLNFEVQRILKICTVGLLYILMGTFARFDNILVSLFFKTIFSVSFFGFLYILKTFDGEEIAYVKKIVREKFS